MEEVEEVDEKERQKEKHENENQHCLTLYVKQGSLICESFDTISASVPGLVICFWL